MNSSSITIASAPPARAIVSPPKAPRLAPAATALRSCLYECRVLHHRFTPRVHRFAYRLFYLAVDLDELPGLHHQLRLFSVNRPNVLSLHEGDFLPLVEPRHHPTEAQPEIGGHDTRTLKARAVAFCAAHDVRLGPEPRVQLVTVPRLLGYQFNPVSFYFCFDSTGNPRAAIAEVTNTFREVKLYFIPVFAGRSHQPAFRRRVAKHFYVSPFSAPELEFEFTFQLPGTTIALQIDDFAGPRRVLHSTLTGSRTALTNARLAWYIFKYSWLTVRIITLIHWQALRLWLKRTPFFPKADRADVQRDLYRPHSSIAERPTP